MDFSYMEKRFSLDGRKAIVTGASGGIGRGIAESLARFGAEVAVLGRNPEKLEDTIRCIRGFGGKAEPFRFDITDPEATDRFFAEYTEKYGAPDIFVANAGSTVLHHATDTSNEDMDHLVATDLKGAMYGMRAAGNLMKEAGRGNIVVVTSVNALYAYPDQAFYSGIKAALENIARSMAADLGRFGVRVNTLAPGAVNTDLCSPHREKGVKMEGLPLGVQADPIDMGDVVSCMVSDAFSYMTGATVLVDGGLMLRKPDRPII